MPPLGKHHYRTIVRQHVRAGSLWAHMMGTDYWLQPNGTLASLSFDQAAAGQASNSASIILGPKLAENGWLSTSLVNTQGAGGDFGALGDTTRTENHFLTNASGDLLESPRIFGTYAHMRAASIIIGERELPDYLIARFWGAMTVHTADEVTSGWGFFEDAGAVETEAVHAGFISSDGTNFQIGANAGTPVNLQADDATWHDFVIVLAVSTLKAYGYVDPTWYFGPPPLGAALGSIAIAADEVPYGFGMHALTTNRPGLGLTHLYYEWD